MVALQPRGLVGGDGEGVGVGFGEHIVAVQLGEYPAGGVFGHAVALRSLQEPLPVAFDQVRVVGAGEGPAQLIGLGGGEARHVHHQLHHLLLPDDDAVAPLQGALLQRVVVVPRGAVAVALHELGDGAALHSDARADEGNLVGQIQQVAGVEPLAHLELGWRLEQEDSLGLSLVNQVVDFRVFGVYAREVGAVALSFFDEVQGLVQLVQHRQGEQVNLGETSVGHAVLVPVHDVAALHGPCPGRHHLRDGGTAEHQAAHVLAQRPGRVHQLGGQLYQVAPSGSAHPVAEGGKFPHLELQRGGVMGVQLLGQQGQLLLRQPQGLAEVLDDALDAVGGNCPGQHGELRPEASVHPLDELVAQLPREVQVYIREQAGVFGYEALQRQVPLQGVDVADADEVAH